MSNVSSKSSLDIVYKETTNNQHVLHLKLSNIRASPFLAIIFITNSSFLSAIVFLASVVIHSNTFRSYHLPIFLLRSPNLHVLSSDR